MSFVFYNPNPMQKLSGDCVIRAITKAKSAKWEEIYTEICMEGFRLCEMPSTNRVWGSYLLREGYKRNAIPDSCPDCYTVSDFSMDNPFGTFILATGDHVVTVQDGDYYDTWDSGNEVPIYFFRKE